MNWLGNFHAPLLNRYLNQIFIDYFCLYIWVRFKAAVHFLKGIVISDVYPFGNVFNDFSKNNIVHSFPSGGDKLWQHAKDITNL